MSSVVDSGVCGRQKSHTVDRSSVGQGVCTPTSLTSQKCFCIPDGFTSGHARGESVSTTSHAGPCCCISDNARYLTLSEDSRDSDSSARHRGCCCFSQSSYAVKTTECVSVSATPESGRTQCTTSQNACSCDNAECACAKTSDDISVDSGCCCCSTKRSRSCARPSTYLLCISALFLTQSLLVSGYTSSVLTTMEKRYDMWSSQTGLVVSSYDIASVVAVLVVSYLGDQHNRAKWLGRGAIIMSIGAMIFTLPHFIGEDYTGIGVNETDNDLNLCNSTRNQEIQHKLDNCDSKSNESWTLATFIIAQMLIGVGAAPVYTLGPTYLHDNVKPRLYALYAGVMFSMSALGPALGFLLGALFLTFYVEPGATIPETVKEGDTGWIGAWWAGFILCAALAVLVGLPLLMFPRQLPGVGKATQTKKDKPVVMGFGKNIKELPRSTWKLLCNPTWLGISFAMILEQSITSGFVTFIAKYFQISFNMLPTAANILTGCIIIPAAITGILTGGALMSKLQLDVPGIVKMLLIMSFIPAAAVVTLLFLGCKNMDLAGVNSDYMSNQFNEDKLVEKFHVSYKENLAAVCNANCACSQSRYEPVCGYNHKTYFSPCHAGCTKLHTYIDDSGMIVRNYTSCACVYEDFVHWSAVASSGKCDNGCYNMVPFLVILFFIIFFTSCGQNPALLVTLRSVNEGERSFALGIQNILSRLIAFIPAPIYFGKIFDNECLLWSPTCTGNGACLEYNSQHLPFTLFGTCLGVKFGVIVCLLVTYVASVRQNKMTSRYDMDEAPNSTESPEVFRTADPQVPVSTISASYTIADRQVSSL